MSVSFTWGRGYFYIKTSVITFRNRQQNINSRYMNTYNLFVFIVFPLQRHRDRKLFQISIQLRVYVKIDINIQIFSTHIHTKQKYCL